MKRIFFLGLALTALSGAAALADDDSACAKFKWSVAHERQLLATPKPFGDGDALTPDGPAYRVPLIDNAKVAFAATPERAEKPGLHGEIAPLRIASDGTYDVTLSDEGWIDVVQNGARVSSSDFSGQKGCPGVRKSVRFQLKAGAYSVQLSNVEGDAINVVVAPAP